VTRGNRERPSTGAGGGFHAVSHGGTVLSERYRETVT